MFSSVILVSFFAVGQAVKQSAKKLAAELGYKMKTDRLSMCQNDYRYGTSQLLTRRDPMSEERLENSCWEDHGYETLKEATEACEKNESCGLVHEYQNTASSISSYKKVRFYERDYRTHMSALIKPGTITADKSLVSNLYFKICGARFNTLDGQKPCSCGRRGFSLCTKGDNACDAEMGSCRRMRVTAEDIATAKREALAATQAAEAMVEAPGVTEEDIATAKREALAATHAAEAMVEAPSDCSGSSHDGSSYMTQATCEASGICSDRRHNDQQEDCLAAGACNDGPHKNKKACEAANAIWTPATWTGKNYTWNSDCSGSSHDGSSYMTQATCEASGICSDRRHNDQQEDCLAAGACNDGQYANKTSPHKNKKACEAANAIWIPEEWTGKNYTWNPPALKQRSFLAIGRELNVRSVLKQQQLSLAPYQE